MKKKLKKVTTIEDLATLMQGEFLVIHEKFAEVHEKMDTGFRRIDEQLDEMRQEIKR
jgi:uncharacterized protein YlzI (FlbEa/FlbD family)